LNEMKRIKPASAKGIYFKSVFLSTTMGPGYRIDVSQI
jgi:large subunit ribosomal protein L1